MAVPAHEALASGRPHRPWWMPALFSAVAWGYGLNEGKKCRRGGWRSGAGGGPDVAWRLGGTLVGPGAPCRGTRYPHERPALRLTFRGTCAGSRGECPAFLATSQAPGRWTRAHGAQAAPCPDTRLDTLAALLGTDAYSHTRICTHTLKYTFTLSDTHACTHTHTHTLRHSHTCTHALYTHSHTLRYTCIYTHIHTCTHTFMHIHSQALTHMHTHSYTYIHTVSDIHTCTHMHTHAHTHTHIHTQIHTHGHTHRHTHSHALTHTHTFRHTHSHRCAHTLSHTLAGLQAPEYPPRRDASILVEPFHLPASVWQGGLRGWAR